MTVNEKKRRAQDLIMDHLSSIGYGDKYDEYVSEIGSNEDADKIMMKQMNRVAKMFGFDRAWFS